ncbi:MFS transporter, partial [Candidatus Bathyarchaeota archaeon]
MQNQTTKLEDTMPLTAEKPMRDFWIIFTGQAFSLLGSRLVQFSLVWWLTSTTGSAAVLATASIMALLPQVFVTPFAGAFIDRWDRRKVLMGVDAMNSLAIIVLMALFAAGVAQPVHVYAVMFVRALGGAFQWPAMQASTSLMVDADKLSKVAGLNQALMGLAAIVAPPLGVMLMDFFPLQWVLSVDVVTAAMAILPLTVIMIPRPKNGAQKTGSTVVTDLVEGFRFIRGWTGLLIIVGVAMAFNFLIVPAISLTPLLVTGFFNGSSVQYAILETTMGLGMVAGGISLGVWGGFKKRIVTALLGSIGLGLGLGLVGLAPSNRFLVAVAGMAIAGLMNPIVNGSFFAIMQSTVPPEMQGRVIAIVMSGTAAMAPLGLAVAGPLAEVVGIRTWFILGGALIVVMGAIGFLVPAVMNIEEMS